MTNKQEVSVETNGSKNSFVDNFSGEQREIISDLLEVIADLHSAPEGAHNIRVDGKLASRYSTENIKIEPKTDGNEGIDVTIAPNTKDDFVHIPVMIDESGVKDIVYNDFYIGEGAEVTIVAGCGIHNTGKHLTQHDGIHTFHVGKNARVKYTEKHYGEGGGSGENVLNPVAVVHLDEGAVVEMESVQIEGVDSTNRVTKATVAEDASFVSKEVIMTSGAQTAETTFEVELDGENSSANVVSRSVAKDDSHQVFTSIINGNSNCYGHSECDAIIMGDAIVAALPNVTANHVDARLIHEAAIGKIAGEQLDKLMTLGLTEEEAEQEIIAGFLR